MDTIGRHLLVDFWGCPKSVLEDTTELIKTLRSSLSPKSRDQLVHASIHSWRPQRSAVTVLLPDVHVTLHAYPDKAHAALDLYTSSHQGPTGEIVETISKALDARSYSVASVSRGANRKAPSVSVLDVYREKKAS